MTTLIRLECHETKIADLSPLKDLKLDYLDIHATPVTDLTPLAQIPLNNIDCDVDSERKVTILRSMKSLKTINNKPINDFWNEFKPDANSAPKL